MAETSINNRQAANARFNLVENLSVRMVLVLFLSWLASCSATAAGTSLVRAIVLGFEKPMTKQ